MVAKEEYINKISVDKAVENNVETFIYYKKSGENIPIVSGIDSPFVPQELYDKLINDFKPVLPLYWFANGASFRVQNI